MRTFLLGLVLVSQAVFAGENVSAVTGTWKGQMDGLPAIALTISDEGETLTGAILFYMIRKDEGQPARASAGTPEPMFRMKLEGNVLSFQISHRRAHGARTANDPPVKFWLRVSGDGVARLTKDMPEGTGLEMKRD